MMKSALIAAALLALVLCGCSSEQPQDLNAKLVDMEIELDGMKNKLAEARARTGDLKSELSATQKKIKALEQQEQKKQAAAIDTYPRAFSHIGISVPDLEKAVEFYSEVMGWYLIMKPTVITEESDTPIGIMCTDVFGTGWGSFKIAHMSTGDRIGIEMFEFKNNEKPKEFDYWKTSTFHFGVQDPDLEGLVKKIVAHGGKQRMPIREYYPGEKPYRMVYVEDPFGLIFELYSHSYELTYSQGAY
jgi:lactoylglutathione lyase family protein